MLRLHASACSSVSLTSQDCGHDGEESALRYSEVAEHFLFRKRSRLARIYPSYRCPALRDRPHQSRQRRERVTIRSVAGQVHVADSQHPSCRGLHCETHGPLPPPRTFGSRCHTEVYAPREDVSKHRSARTCPDENGSPITPYPENRSALPSGIANRLRSRAKSLGSFMASHEYSQTAGENQRHRPDHIQVDPAFPQDSEPEAVHHEPCG